jgi:hypothetical protein
VQTLDIKSKRAEASGHCTLTAAGDDVVYSAWKCTGVQGACEGEFTLTGGTGKFAGITGGGKLIVRAGPLRDCGQLVEWWGGQGCGRAGRMARTQVHDTRQVDGAIHLSGRKSMRRPAITLFVLIASIIVCLSIGTLDSLAWKRAPTNPRGAADPRGAAAPRGVYDPR